MTETQAARPALASVGAFAPPAHHDRGAALVLLGMEIDETRREIAALLGRVGSAQPHRFAARPD